MSMSFHPEWGAGSGKVYLSSCVDINSWIESWIAWTNSQVEEKCTIWTKNICLKCACMYGSHLLPLVQTHVFPFCAALYFYFTTIQTDILYLDTHSGPMLLIQQDITAWRIAKLGFGLNTFSCKPNKSIERKWQDSGLSWQLHLLKDSPQPLVHILWTLLKGLNWMVTLTQQNQTKEKEGEMN